MSRCRCALLLAHWFAIATTVGQEPIVALPYHLEFFTGLLGFSNGTSALLDASPDLAAQCAEAAATIKAAEDAGEGPALRRAGTPTIYSYAARPVSYTHLTLPTILLV